MKRLHTSKGQTIIIMAIGAIVLLGLVAVAVDGGSAMLQRRNAQNGADAGSLAGIQYMASGGHLTVSCYPDAAHCHPAYTVTNQQVADAINTMAAANRGGVVGDATYSLSVEYHYMDGSTPTYRAAGAAGDLVPPGVDGLRVSVNINAPTTFGRALNFNTIAVSAWAAARIYPTCPPSDSDTGPTLPFTRFRARLEQQLASGTGNEPCHPLPFWNPQGDIANNSNFNNMISFNLQHFPEYGSGAQQITQLDYRNGMVGVSQTPSPGNNYQQSNSWIAGPCTLYDCADMRGQGATGGSNTTGAAQDIGNWSYWIWAGKLSATSNNWAKTTGTWYPANRTNNAGQQGNTTQRTGDWADVYQAGQWGSNVQESIHDLANDNGIVDPVLSGGTINWGKYVTRTMFLWGNPWDSTSTYQSRNDAQIYLKDYNYTGPGCGKGGCTYTGWEDLVLTKATNGAAAAGNYYNADFDTSLPGVSGGNTGATISRVHFTKGVTLQFFANLQGNYNPGEPPGGCSAYGGFDWSPTGSIVWGLLPDSYVPNPNPGGCGWQPGGAVYSRGVDPTSP